MRAETIAFPLPQNSKKSEELLRMIMENAHVEPCAICPGNGVMMILLEDWQIDLLAGFGVASEDLEDSDDDEDAALL